MRVARFITNLRTKDVGPDLIQRLITIWPIGDRARFEFRAEVPLADVRLPLLLAELQRAGLKPTNKYFDFAAGKEYVTGLMAQYEPEDYESARYLSTHLLFSPRFLSENSDNPRPVARLFMKQGDLSDVLFACSDSDCLLATNAGRAAIESEKLVGAEFVPAYAVHPDTHEIDELNELIDSGQVPNLGPPPLWEVRPTVVLPPMLPLSYTHEINGVQRVSRNPVAVDRRMAYARADLDAIAPFDFASPSPAEDGTKAMVDPIVVSQRFFQLAKSEIDDWTPVRLEG